MAVSEGVWFQGMTELAVSFPIADETDETRAIRGQVYRRELQPYMTDHQWRHAVSEAIRTERWFPQVSVLVEWGRSAPPEPPPPSRGYLTAGDGCPLCDGTGFEPFHRAGYDWVRHCSRGCLVPGKDAPRSPQRAEEWTGRYEAAEGWVDVTERQQKRPKADEVTLTALERVKQICREKTAAGIPGFAYAGIEADMKPEPVAVGATRQPGEEG